MTVDNFFIVELQERRSSDLFLISKAGHRIKAELSYHNPLKLSKEETQGRKESSFYDKQSSIKRN